MARYTLSSLIILSLCSLSHANCALLDGRWASQDGAITICNGVSVGKPNGMSIHSLICQQGKAKLISAIGENVVITGYPPVKKTFGDALTFYNGRESLALYYQGEGCLKNQS